MGRGELIRPICARRKKDPYSQVILYSASLPLKKKGRKDKKKRNQQRRGKGKKNITQGKT